MVRRKYGVKNSKYTTIAIHDLPSSKPDLKRGNMAKDAMIRDWLKNWITSAFNTGKIKEDYLLPVKPDIAYYLGTSVGTVQNAIRSLEDMGYVKSKQRVGTLIADFNSPSGMQKLTSKRDKVVEQIKLFICENGLKTGDSLPFVNELTRTLGSKRNTVRSALDFLAVEGVIKFEDFWTLSKDICKEEIIGVSFDEISADTLAQKISAEIKQYIVENCKVGDRLDTLSSLAKKFSVSDKTVHDAVDMLIQEGILQTRRGRYGTLITKMPDDKGFQPSKECSIFLPAGEAVFYSYQKVENYLKKYISENYSVGDKLPCMSELAEKLDVSTNTIRKASASLARDGYIRQFRGRFGGTFVMEIPEIESDSFKWLAVNPLYAQTYKN